MKKKRCKRRRSICYLNGYYHHGMWRQNHQRIQNTQGLVKGKPWG